MRSQPPLLPHGTSGMRIAALRSVYMCTALRSRVLHCALVYVYVHMYMYMYLCVSMFMFVQLCLCLYLCLCSSVRESVCLSVGLSAYAS